MSDRENITALVVEDDPASQKYISLLLNKLEYKFIVADTGEQAIDLMKDRHVDIMLLDIALGPGMSGLDLGKELKKDNKHSETPMIAVSAFSREDVDQLKPAGFVDYLSKPFTIRELESILSKHLD